MLMGLGAALPEAPRPPAHAWLPAISWKLHMRWTLPLLLIAILAIIGGIGATYYARLKDQNAHAAAKPPALPDRTASAAHDWTYTHTVKSKPVVFVRAKDFQEVEGKYH